MVEPKVPILCYHRIHRNDENLLPPPIGQYCGHTLVSDFRQQMEWLAEAGISVVTHEDLYDWTTQGKTLPLPCVVINFDDNRRNVLDNAFPILQEMAWTATMFTVTGLAAGDCPDMMTYPWMDWNDLKVLQEAGWIIGAHTYHHLALADPQHTADTIREELLRSREDIRQHLGVAPKHFAYPVGSWNSSVETVVKQYFKSARHWSPLPPWNYNQPETDPFRLVAINVSAQMPFEEFRQAVSF